MGVIVIEYTDGRVENRGYADYFVALQEQRKLLRDKKFLNKVRSCRVISK